MAKSIMELDKNFSVQAISKNDEFDFYDVRKKPFKIYGLYNPETEKVFKRMPDDVAKTVSEGVEILRHRTAGGRIRFKTNSKRIVLKAFMDDINFLPHMPFAGSAGFDFYTKEDSGYIYRAIALPAGWGNDICNEVSKNGGYESIVNLNDDKMKDITINLPSYNNLNGLYIGIEKNSTLDFGDEYRDILPVVYYGSSITQGGCASRPGNNYPNILSRRYDMDFYNLGFSGCAKGEEEIAHYIAGLEMSCFVYAYDNNAPTSEHLRNTHEKMYNIIREKNPDVPVIFKSRPKVHLTDEESEMKSIIYNTYKKAKEAGHNVYFVDGQEIFNLLGKDSGSVDGIHPNDLGFMCIAEAIDKVFKGIYK